MDNAPHQGLDIVLSDEDRDRAIAWTLAYRGDVTLVCADDSTIEGYVFDHSSDGMLRMDLKDGGRVNIAATDVRSIRFTGRDTAAGKSFDRWIQTWITKTLAGETASIECDSGQD